MGFQVLLSSSDMFLHVLRESRGSKLSDGKSDSWMHH